MKSPLLGKNPETMSRFMAGIGVADFLGDLPEELPEALNRLRPLRLWAQLALRRARIGRELFGKTVSVTENPAFDAWRSCRIASARSELGFFGLTSTIRPWRSNWAMDVA